MLTFTDLKEQLHVVFTMQHDTISLSISRTRMKISGTAPFWKDQKVEESYEMRSMSSESVPIFREVTTKGEITWHQPTNFDTELTTKIDVD